MRGSLRHLLHRLTCDGVLPQHPIDDCPAPVRRDFNGRYHGAAVACPHLLACPNPVHYGRRPRKL